MTGGMKKRTLNLGTILYTLGGKIVSPGNIYGKTITSGTVIFYIVCNSNNLMENDHFRASSFQY